MLYFLHLYDRSYIFISASFCFEVLSIIVVITDNSKIKLIMLLKIASYIFSCVRFFYQLNHSLSILMSYSYLVKIKWSKCNLDKNIV